jgi:hypothetical protein
MQEYKVYLFELLSERIDARIQRDFMLDDSGIIGFEFIIRLGKDIFVLLEKFYVFTLCF